MITMSRFLNFSVLYFILASTVAFLTRDNMLEMIANHPGFSAPWVYFILLVAFVLTCLSLIGNAIWQTKTPREVILDTLSAAVAIIYFQSAFNISKTTMPYILPFFADPALAEADRLLHFGIIPWEATHSWKDLIPIDWLAGLYLLPWLMIAIFFPVLLATLDRNTERVKRTMLLYVISWIFIGNFLALAGLSVGPIFYDRAYDTELFTELGPSLLTTSPNLQIILNTQKGLWAAYAEFDQSRGSGISAFPSVHLSVATVVAIYLYERSALLLPIGVFWVTAILFMSVYSGYHYAIDGYVSIAVMAAIWLYLRRKDKQST